MRWLVIAVVVGLAAPARAQPEPRQRTERYAVPIVVVDVLALGALGGGIAMIDANDSGGARTLGILSTIAGAATYTWGAAIVHILHDRKLVGQLDIAMRIFFVGGGAGIGAAIRACEDEATCDKRETGIAAVIGGGIGALAASTLDVAFLAKRKLAVPYAAPTGGGMMIGLAGTF